MGTFRADYSRTEPPGWLAGRTRRAQRPLAKPLSVCLCVRVCVRVHVRVCEGINIRG